MEPAVAGAGILENLWAQQLRCTVRVGPFFPPCSLAQGSSRPIDRDEEVFDLLFKCGRLIQHYEVARGSNGDSRVAPE
jgi:hypothetical protein